MQHIEANINRYIHLIRLMSFGDTYIPRNSGAQTVGFEMRGNLQRGELIVCNQLNRRNGMSYVAKKAKGCERDETVTEIYCGLGHWSDGVKGKSFRRVVRILPGRKSV